MAEDMKLVVCGAAGRMGRELVRAIARIDGVTLSGAVEAGGSPHLGADAGVLAGIAPTGVLVTDDPLPLVAAAQGVLEFTTPAATLAHAALAAQARIVHIIGTTGLGDADEAAIAAAARHAAIVKAGNMSLGVNLLTALVRKVATALDEDFDIEIVEMHHRHKVDAPSGTALMLGRAAAAGRNVSFEDRAVLSREGQTGARQRGDIGFATLRGGMVVGEHQAIFAADGERVVLSHVASDRGIFATGAVKAALWAHGRGPGLYSMTDVLGLA
jgi:4-hydroxy-tetrahydrodipicolinate reductase